MSRERQRLDREVSRHEVQALGSADALTGFFAYLGYNTDARIQQSPANLGITAEGTIRPIKRVELIADEEALPHMARWIVEQGGALYSMTPQKLALEDLFLQVVGAEGGL